MSADIPNPLTLSQPDQIPPAEPPQATVPGEVMPGAVEAYPSPLTTAAVGIAAADGAGGRGLSTDWRTRAADVLRSLDIMGRDKTALKAVGRMATLCAGIALHPLIAAARFMPGLRKHKTGEWWRGMKDHATAEGRAVMDAFESRPLAGGLRFAVAPLGFALRAAKGAIMSDVRDITASYRTAAQTVADRRMQVTGAASPSETSDSESQ